MRTIAPTMVIAARVFRIGWKRGRPMGASLKPSCLTICVGLAERGQRRAKGPLVELDQSRARFLCRSLLIQTTLGVMQRATARLLHLATWRTKSTVRRATPIGIGRDETGDGSIHCEQTFRLVPLVTCQRYHQRRVTTKYNSSAVTPAKAEGTLDHMPSW